MAKPTRLVTRREREFREQCNLVVQALRDLPQELVFRLSKQERAAISTLRRALRNRADADDSIWPDGGYNMVGRVKLKDVHDRIRLLPSSARPVQVRDALLLVLRSVDKDAAELPYTRREIADEIGCDPSNVTKIMGTLEKLGVLTRERRPRRGYRGLGRVVYVINVDTAWNGDLIFRKQLSAKQRQQQADEMRAKLQLVQSDAAE